MYLLNGERLIDLIKQVSCVCEKTQIGNDVPYIDKTTITLGLHRNVLKRIIGDEVPEGETLEGFTKKAFKHHFENYEKDIDLHVTEPTSLNNAHKKASQGTETNGENDPTIVLTSFSMPAVKALSKLLLYNVEVHVTDITRKKASLDDKGEPEIKTYTSRITYDDCTVMQYPDVDIFHYKDAPFNKNTIHGEILKDHPIEINPEEGYLSFRYSLASFYRNPKNADEDFDTASKRLIENEMRQILHDHNGREKTPDQIIGSNMVSHGYTLHVENVPDTDHEIRVCIDFFYDTLFMQAIKSFGLEEEYKDARARQRNRTLEENGNTSQPGM